MVGKRFDYQDWPQGQRGGLNYFPHVGIINGLIVSSPAGNGTNNPNLQVNVSAGSARLDGQLVTLAAAITTLVLPNANGGADLSTSTVDIPIYLNPSRLVQALITGTPASPTAGQRYVKVVDVGPHLQVDKFQIYTNSVWVDYNAVESEPGYSQNNLPLNGISPTISTATSSNPNISLTQEKAIYHKVNQPPYVYAPSAAMFRQPASVKLATVRIVAGTMSVIPYGDDYRITI